MTATGLLLDIPFEHPSFAGHFPGQPLLPGVVLLSLALEAVLAQPGWAQRLGSEPKLAAAKFLAPVRPGMAVHLQLVDEGKALRFEALLADGTVAASGRWDCAAVAQ